MSFVATILENARRAGDRTVLFEVHGTRLQPTSGRQLLEAVSRARAFLRGAGVSPGDRVGLLGPNSTRWVAADLAILAHGAIAVPLYARQDPGQLAAMLQDCSASLLLVADSALEGAMADAWPEHVHMARYDDVFGAPAEESATDPTAGDSVAVEPDEAVTLIYTSGTSGEPKGAMLSAANIDFMLAVTVRELGKMTGQGRSEDRVFHYLPFCFAGSRIMLWSQLYRGNPLMMSSDLNNLQQEMATAAAHYYMNVPALLERIKNGVTQRIENMGGAVRAVYERTVAAHRRQLQGQAGRRDALLALAGRKLLFPRIKRLIGPNLEFLVCGSAPLSEDTQRWFEMIGIPVYQVYGLTETTAIVTIDDTSGAVAGRVGYPIEGCELRLGDNNELLCRGPNVFLGYWNRPQATAEALREGWLHTGDQAELDHTGSVRILGRVRDVLVPESGHNIAPGPIEERLTSASSGVEHAVVLGHGRPFLTAIITGSTQHGELETLRNQVNGQLPHYMRLRKIFHAPEPFTVENGLLTANQKIKRAAIETRYREAIEQMYR